jgi:chorismate-pyruvate lyase
MTATHVLTLAPDVGDAAHDPLRELAASSGIPLGSATPVEPWQLPRPYRTLLVHEGSMTRRLECHFGSPVALTIVSVASNHERYARWVLLHDATGRCLELGGVCLDLRRFAADLRADIVAGAEPLGRLLSRHGLTYESVPHAFFTVRVTAPVEQRLQMAESRHVFGRRTDLRAGGRKLGDVVEVLPCYDVQALPTVGHR